MKKNIVIVLLSIITLLSLSFGFIQKSRADKFEAIAIENARKAEEAMQVAERNLETARQQRAIAAEAARRAQIAAQRNLDSAQQAKK